MKNDEPILTISGAARLLERSEGTVRIWADSKKLRSVRASNGTRLFREHDVKEFAAKQSREPVHGAL